MPTPSIEEKTERAMMGKTFLIMWHLKHYSALLWNWATDLSQLSLWERRQQEIGHHNFC